MRLIPLRLLVIWTLTYSLFLVVVGCDRGPSAPPEALREVTETPIGHWYGMVNGRGQTVIIEDAGVVQWEDETGSWEPIDANTFRLILDSGTYEIPFEREPTKLRMQVPGTSGWSEFMVE